MVDVEDAFGVGRRELGVTAAGGSWKTPALWPGDMGVVLCNGVVERTTEASCASDERAKGDGPEGNMGGLVGTQRSFKVSGMGFVGS